jgi:4-coumarate--CoA ligase
MFQGFIEANDVQLGVLPFQHIFALSKNICHAPFVGCSVVVLPKFDLTAWLEAVQRHKITVTMIVPPILVLLAKSPIVEKYDLSSLKAVMSGAAPLSAELGDEVEARIPTLKVTQGYGLTETSP